MKSKLQFSNWSFKKSLLVLAVALFSFSNVNAQSLISFPTNPEDITTCNGSSLLTVRVAFGENLAGGDITVTLAPGMEYVSGSVIKTGSSPAGLTITENGGTPAAPVFAVTGPIVPGNNISFTILRSGTCVSRTEALNNTVFTDSVTVAGNGGPSTKVSPIYLVNYPSLSFGQPSHKQMQ